MYLCVYVYVCVCVCMYVVYACGTPACLRPDCMNLE